MTNVKRWSYAFIRKQGYSISLSKAVLLTPMFDSITRTDTSCKKRAETIFRYLNKSARPGSEVSRALIEEMLSRVPRDSRRELCSRFRSGSDAEFASAFQELCLHDLLIRQECALLPHPSIAGTTKRPDFLVFGRVEVSLGGQEFDRGLHRPLNESSGKPGAGLLRRVRTQSLQDWCH